MTKKTRTEEVERAESAAAAHRMRELKRRHDQERRIVELALTVEVPEGWSDDEAAGEAFTILDLSEDGPLRPIRLEPRGGALRNAAKAEASAWRQQQAIGKRIADQ